MSHCEIVTTVAVLIIPSEDRVCCARQTKLITWAGSVLSFASQKQVYFVRRGYGELADAAGCEHPAWLKLALSRGTGAIAVG